MTHKQTSMFPNGEDTPLFSGTTQPGKESTFTKKDEPQQGKLYNCPVCRDTGYYRMKYSTRPFIHRCEYCQAALELEKE